MRRAGILLHPTSLPGPGPCGDLGEGAYRFLDWLQRAGCTLWQTLPLNPAGGGFSPYGSPSSLAGATHLISLDKLVADGLLAAGDLQDRPSSGASWAERVDVDALERWHQPRLRLAATRLAQGAPAELERFAAEQPWALDWARFEAARQATGSTGWLSFPPDLQAREPAALERLQAEQGEAISREIAAQYLFFRQWAELRAAARSRGISLVGDVPIFVAGDGCDAWCHRDLFRWAADGRAPDPVTGAPPDDFSAVGQRWGNPHYAWPAHESSGFAWWIERFRAVLSLVDAVRIDHFRGFAAAWEIPAGAQDARSGAWGPSPGAALFAAVRDALGDLPLIAEDLGVITPDVEELRGSLGVPGMKVLQFAFGGTAVHEYLPHNYASPTCVAYSGTHDTDTAQGWYDKAPEPVRHRYRVYAGRDGSEPGWDLARLAWASIAQWAIAPLQDVLGLDTRARMNTPGQAEGNWRWRAGWLPEYAADRLREMGWSYGRE